MINTPFDIGSHVNTVKGGIAAQADTASAATNGTGFDRTGYMSCKAHLSVGAATGSPTTSTVAFKLQDSADNSTFADFVPNTGAASIAAVSGKTAASFNEVSINLLGAKKYIRAVGTSVIAGGTSPTQPYAVALVMGGALNEPA